MEFKCSQLTFQQIMSMLSIKAVFFHGTARTTAVGIQLKLLIDLWHYNSALALT